jgi:hypothetical protein
VPVLRVRVSGLPDALGVTASLGAVARLHADYRHAWVQGKLGVAELLARLALQRLPGERFAPVAGPFELDPGPSRLAGVTLGIISPLPHFFEVVRPFAGVQTVAHGPQAHMTLANLGPLAMQAALPGLLRGLLSLHPQVHCAPCRRLAWHNGDATDVVVLDGEELTVGPRARVEIEVAAQVRMVVWRDLPAQDAHV